jgi:hypothetical protein
MLKATLKRKTWTGILAGWKPGLEKVHINSQKVGEVWPIHHRPPRLGLTHPSESPQLFAGPLTLVGGPALDPALSGVLQLEIQMVGLGPRIIEPSTLLPLSLILSCFLLNFWHRPCFMSAWLPALVKSASSGWVLQLFPASRTHRPWSRQVILTSLLTPLEEQPGCNSLWGGETHNAGRVALGTWTSHCPLHFLALWSCWPGRQRLSPNCRRPIVQPAHSLLTWPFKGAKWEIPDRNCHQVSLSSGCAKCFQESPVSTQSRFLGGQWRPLPV